jgi:hypothetical protein
MHDFGCNLFNVFLMSIVKTWASTLSPLVCVTAPEAPLAPQWLSPWVHVVTRKGNSFNSGNKAKAPATCPMQKPRSSILSKRSIRCTEQSRMKQFRSNRSEREREREREEEVKWTLLRELNAKWCKFSASVENLRRLANLTFVSLSLSLSLSLQFECLNYKCLERPWQFAFCCHSGPNRTSDCLNRWSSTWGMHTPEVTRVSENILRGMKNWKKINLFRDKHWKIRSRFMVI